MQSISQMYKIKEILLEYGADENQVNKVMRRYARSGISGKHVAKRFVNELSVKFGDLGLDKTTIYSLLIAQLEDM